MELDGDVLHIDGTIDFDEIRDFAEFVQPRLEYIEAIEIEGDGSIKNSALIALLVSIHRTRPAIRVPFLDQKTVSSPFHGTLHWICHD